VHEVLGLLEAPFLLAADTKSCYWLEDNKLRKVRIIYIELMAFFACTTTEIDVEVLIFHIPASE